MSSYKYRYEGPVMVFDRLVQETYVGETIAPTPSKARSNLIFRWKKQNNRSAGSKVTLPGRVTCIG